MNYGRKTVRQKTYEQKILKLLFIILMFGLFIGFIVGYIITSNDYKTSIRKYGTVAATLENHDFNYLMTAAELGFVPLKVDMDIELQEYVYCLSYANNIDFAFVMGLIQTESNFKTDVVSKTNDYGLMQINKINHSWLSKELGINNFNDPYQNVRAGIYILRDLFEKYEDNSKVLMAYNLGETGAKRLWVQDIYETTYSKKVLKNAENFNSEIGGESNVVLQ